MIPPMGFAMLMIPKTSPRLLGSAYMPVRMFSIVTATPITPQSTIVRIMSRITLLTYPIKKVAGTAITADRITISLRR